MNEQAMRISAVDVHKSYGAVRALRNGQLRIRPGETHALVGENGAGKSTIIKILSGAIQRDGGTLQIDGEHYSPGNPHEALRAGVGTVYQDPQIVSTMTVCENIMLGRFPTKGAGTIQKRSMKAAAKQLIDSLEIHLNPDATCEALSVADRQLLQVARAASFQALKFLILDEPTSSLTPSEVNHLFQLVDRLRRKDISVLFVSHKLDEVKEHADEVTVFRDGQFIASHRRGEYTVDSLVREMVGRELEAAPAKLAPPERAKSRR